MMSGQGKPSPVLPEPTGRETTRHVDGHGRSIDEITKLLMKLQSQEGAAAEKVLSGQGELLNKKIKEIDDKYLGLHSTLRAFKEYLGQMTPSDLQKREDKLRTDRAEVEKMLAAVNAREGELLKREKDLEARLKDADYLVKLDDLIRREKQLAEEQAELDTRAKAFRTEFDALEVRKVEVARDWEKLSVEKGSLVENLDKRADELDAAEKALTAEKAAYRKKLEEDVFGAIQRAVVDLIRSRYPSG